MKYLFFILLILFTACLNKQAIIKENIIPPNSKKVTIQLLDSLGTVTLYIPFRYDTSFQWTNWSDCGDACAKKEYRFQRKAFRISKESGWIYIGTPKDSIEQFTILHSGYIQLHDGTDSNLIKFHKIKRYELQEQPWLGKIQSDTIEKIFDRFYSIYILSKYDTLNKQYMKNLFATTSIKSNQIEFRYKLLSKVNDSINQNFIENSKKSLQTIQLSKGL